MNSRNVLKKVIVIAVVFQLAFGQGLFAATTNKNFTLDDNDVHSPLVIMRDAGEKIFTLQKLNGGAAELINNEGSIDFKPNNDTDDYLQMLTTGDSSYLYWLGVSNYTNNPGIRVNPTTGELEYRDENESTWTTLDGMSGSATTLGGLSDTTFASIAHGDVVYYDGGAWVNLGPGTNGYFLKTQGTSADPVWAAVTGTIAGGTTANSTLRWVSPNWVESTILTNDGTDITLAGKLMPNAHQTLDMGSAASAWNMIYAKRFKVIGSETGFYHDGTDAHIVTDTGSFHFENTSTNADINLVIKATGGQDAHFVTDRGGAEHIIISDDGDKIIFMEDVDEDLHFWENDTLHRTVHIHDDVQAIDGLQAGDDGTDGQLTIYSEQTPTDYSVIFRPNAAMTQITTYILPADDGTTDQVLKTDGSGALSWTTITGTIANGTADNNTLRWNGSNWVQSTALTNDGTNVTVGGDLTVSGNDITFGNAEIISNVIDGELTITGNLVPATNNAYSIGSLSKQWKELYVASGTIYIGGVELTNSSGQLQWAGEGGIQSTTGSSSVASLAVSGALTVTGTSQLSSAVGIGQASEAAAHLALGATTTTVAQINLDNTAVDPSSPNIGDLWFNANKLNFRKDDSTTVDLLAGSALFSGLGAATATNTIDNTNYAQTWDWTTASTETALSMNFNGLTTGNGMEIASTGSTTGLTGALASISLTRSDATNTGNLLLIEDSGAANTTTPFKVTAASTDTAQVAALIENTGAGTSFRVNDVGSDTTPFIIDAAGNVGIGMEPSSAKLSVKASFIWEGIRLYNSDDKEIFFVHTDDNRNSEFGLCDAGGTRKIQLNGNTGDSYFNGGNVGIGTTTPGYPLDVVSTIACGTHNEKSGYLRLRYGDVATGEGNIYTDTTYGLVLDTSFNGRPIKINGSEIHLAIAGGNVGIGTTTPGTALDINGALSQRSMGTPAVSEAGQGRIYFDSSSATFKVSENGGSYSNLIGSALFSSLSAATATNTLDNLNYAQTWNWTTASTETALSMNFAGLTTGTGMELASSATGLTGALASISLTGDNAANTGNLLLVADSGAANTTTPFKVTAGGAATQVAVLIENTGVGTSFRVNDEASVSETTPFIIDAAGNVGIGTNAPHAPLQIGNLATNRSIVIWEDFDNDHQFMGFGINPDILRYQTSKPAVDHVFYSGIDAGSSKELMRIEGTGNVGIGTTAPSATLDVRGIIHISESMELALEKTGDRLTFIDFHSSDDMDYSSRIIRWAGVNGGTDITAKGTGGINIMTENAAPIVLKTSNTERMTIDSAGKVGIGTTAPTAKLDVDGTVRLRDVAAADGGFVTSDNNGNLIGREMRMGTVYIGNVGKTVTPTWTGDFSSASYVSHAADTSTLVSVSFATPMPNNWYMVQVTCVGDTESEAALNDTLFAPVVCTKTTDNFRIWVCEYIGKDQELRLDILVIDY